jgi:2,3-bisphosphoglycerate-independent phosphoglycerate mutase
MISLELLRTITTKTETKIIQLVMDGLGGLPDETGKSELETARTPNLDQLARDSICGLADPVAKGITPGSGPGHLAIFGYDPLIWDIGRGVLEALGIGFEFQPGDVAARGNFVTLSSDGTIADRRAGRIPTEKCVELCRMLQENIQEIDGVQMVVRPVKEHRFALVLRGGNLGDHLEDTDPQKVGLPPKPAIAHDETSKKTAAIVDKFVERACSVLADQRPANGMTLRGFSRRPDIPSMQEAYKLTPAAIATYPMYRGLAKLVGMTIIETPPEEDLAALVTLLRENYDRHDYFYVHVKKTDSCGEDGNFAGKVKVIERVDEIIIPAILSLNPDVLAITGDHSTPSVLAGHSWHPVPYLLHAKHIHADEVAEFSERAFARGGLGRIRLVEGLPQLLAHAQKLLKYGA